MTKRFYSVPDTASVREIPQPIQHLANGAMAKDLGGEIVFYTMEDHYTLKTHEVILSKLAEQPVIDGIIFFRVAQFINEGTLSFSLLKQLLERNLLISFAREKITIYTSADLNRLFPMLCTYAMLQKRDKDRVFTHQVLELLPY